MSETPVDKAEAELREQIAKLRVITGCQDETKAGEAESEAQTSVAPVEVQHILKMPAEALVWIQACEVNNQMFQSNLQKRISSDQPVTYVPEGETLTMLCNGKVIFTAKRTLLGIHSYRTVAPSDPEVQTGGIAPGTYHSWLWPWAVYDDDPRSQEIKPQVDAMLELDHHRKDISMFEDIITLRYILAVLCKNMGFEHVLPISPENNQELDHIFGLKSIVFSPLEKAEAVSSTESEPQPCESKSD